MPRLWRGTHPHLASPLTGKGTGLFEIASAMPRNDNRAAPRNDNYIFAVATLTESTQGIAHLVNSH